MAFHRLFESLFGWFRLFEVPIRVSKEKDVLCIGKRAEEALDVAPEGLKRFVSMDHEASPKSGLGGRIQRDRRLRGPFGP